MEPQDENKKTSGPDPKRGGGPKKTIEEWATAKGMLPEQLVVPARLGSREVQAARQNPQFVQYAIAKAHRQWPEGKEVTEAEFDQAVAEGGQVELR